MKYLSFIAVLFYLSLLFPTAGHSASSSWVASATHTSVDLTETPTDDDKSSVSWNSFEFPAAQNRFYQQPETSFHTVQQSCYAARAPPLYLS